MAQMPMSPDDVPKLSPYAQSLLGNAPQVPKQKLSGTPLLQEIAFGNMDPEGAPAGAEPQGQSPMSLLGGMAEGMLPPQGDASQVSDPAYTAQHGKFWPWQNQSQENAYNDSALYGMGMVGGGGGRGKLPPEALNMTDVRAGFQPFGPGTRAIESGAVHDLHALPRSMWDMPGINQDGTGVIIHGDNAPGSNFFPRYMTKSEFAKGPAAAGHMGEPADLYPHASKLEAAFRGPAANEPIFRDAAGFSGPTQQGPSRVIGEIRPIEGEPGGMGWNFKTGNTFWTPDNRPIPEDTPPPTSRDPLDRKQIDPLDQFRFDTSMEGVRPGVRRDSLVNAWNKAGGWNTDVEPGYERMNLSGERKFMPGPVPAYGAAPREPGKYQIPDSTGESTVPMTKHPSNVSWTRPTPDFTVWRPGEGPPPIPVDQGAYPGPAAPTGGHGTSLPPNVVKQIWDELSKNTKWPTPPEKK